VDTKEEVKGDGYVELIKSLGIKHKVAEIEKKRVEEAREAKKREQQESSLSAYLR